MRESQTWLIRGWSKDSISEEDKPTNGRLTADLEMGRTTSEESFMRCELCFQMIDLSDVCIVLASCQAFVAGLWQCPP